MISGKKNSLQEFRGLALEKFLASYCAERLFVRSSLSETERHICVFLGVKIN